MRCPMCMDREATRERHKVERLHQLLRLLGPKMHATHAPDDDRRSHYLFCPHVDCLNIRRGLQDAF